MAEKKKREKWGVSRQISIPADLDDWLKKGAVEAHRSISGHIAFLLEQLYNPKRKKE